MIFELRQYDKTLLTKHLGIFKRNVTYYAED